MQRYADNNKVDAVPLWRVPELDDMEGVRLPDLLTQGGKDAAGEQVKQSMTARRLDSDPVLRAKVNLTARIVEKLLGKLPELAPDGVRQAASQAAGELLVPGIAPALQAPPAGAPWTPEHSAAAIGTASRADRWASKATRLVSSIIPEDDSTPLTADMAIIKQLRDYWKEAEQEARKEQAEQLQQAGLEEQAAPEQSSSGAAGIAKTGGGGDGSDSDDSGSEAGSDDVVDELDQEAEEEAEWEAEHGAAAAPSSGVGASPRREWFNIVQPDVLIAAHAAGVLEKRCIAVNDRLDDQLENVGQVKKLLATTLTMKAHLLLAHTRNQSARAKVSSTSASWAVSGSKPSGCQPEPHPLCFA